MARPAVTTAIEIDDVRVTFIPDGYGQVTPHEYLSPSDPSQWIDAGEQLDSEGYLPLSFGGFLVEQGGEKTLIDLGLGQMTVEAQAISPAIGPLVGGRFMKGLRAAGVDPHEVSSVIFTHLHLDHHGWAYVDSERTELTFPNATHVVHEVEWEHWGSHPEEQTFHSDRRLLDRLRIVGDGDIVGPGFRVLETRGHSPGHISLQLGEGSRRLIVVGDLFYCPLHFEHLEWNSVSEFENERAVLTREQMLHELEQTGTVAAIGHFADDVFGSLDVSGGSPRWTPISMAAAGKADR